MTSHQRSVVNAMLRHPRPSGPQPGEPQTIEAKRAGFAAMMATMRVADGIRTTSTSLGDRPAVLVEPTQKAEPGDALAAYRALLDGGIEPLSIAFTGDSAGGGIAVSACLAARDAGLPRPAAVVAFSPGLDYTRTGASIDSKAGLDPFFTREGLGVTAAMYLAGQDPAQELLSPAIHADPHRVPPLLLQVGTNELLLDDSTRMAERARAAGVDVILDVTGDVPHVFQSFTGLLDEADQALDRAALFLTQHLGG